MNDTTARPPTPEVTVTFNTELVTQRIHDLDMTVPAFAGEIGASPASVYSWLAGTRELPKVVALAKMAAVLSRRRPYVQIHDPNRPEVSLIHVA